MRSRELARRLLLISTLPFVVTGELLAEDAKVGVDLTNAYYISPAGSDSNDGRSETRPFRTFARAFSQMPGGGTLALLDGTYSVAAGTGVVHWEGAGSGQPPSGMASQPTELVALHPGKATVKGTLFIGRSFRKDSYIRIFGITFEGGGFLYNTSYVTVANCGFHGTFTVGTNDHHQGNTRNLVEDVWIWAAGQRIIAINYRAHENVWRRVVVRGDGCGKVQCEGSGNPNVGITVYDSRDVSMQNVIVVDRILSGRDSGYADFAIAQHTDDPQYYIGRNEWLGTISLRAPDSGYYFEAGSNVIHPTVRMLNAVAWDARQGGINVTGLGSLNLSNVTIKSATGDGLRVAPELKDGTVRNVLVAGAGRFGVNSAITPAYVDLWGAAVADYSQTRCVTGCYTLDPQAIGSVKQLPRIEPGSYLSGRGAGGADIGANIVNRYGVDGTRFGDTDYNKLTTAALWPWPNEARIKSEMCDQSGITRGFCSAPSLTQYIWDYLNGWEYLYNQPATMALHAGDGQSAITGNEVAVDPAVAVQDASGKPVAGVTVVFAVSTGYGTVTSATVRTDLQGIATVGGWRLGTAGTNTLVATTSALPTAKVTFTATALRPQPVWHPWFAVNKLESPMVGDFNGDLRTDIITFTRQNPSAVGDVYVALSEGTQFGPNVKWHDWFAISTDETVVIGDYDGDRRDDIATWLGKSTRQVYVAKSYGTGMTRESVWANSIGYDPTDVIQAGDVNGDGKSDLVCFARKQAKVYVALSTGSSFQAPALWHSWFAASTYERPQVADVNGDRKADIVTFATNSPTAIGDVYVAVSDGRQFGPNAKWHDWFAVQPTERVRIGDLDGDGKDDFFTFMPEPSGQCYTVRSQGTSMGANVLWRESVAPLATDTPDVGDANGDGRADVIIFAQGEGKVYVSLGP